MRGKVVGQGREEDKVKVEFEQPGGRWDMFAAQIRRSQPNSGETVCSRVCVNVKKSSN